MSEGSPAPDLFDALAWSDRVAPLPVDTTGEPRAELTSPGLERPVGRPRQMPAIASPITAAPAGAGFGGLADALEPGADVSPPLDELEGLLDIFEDVTAEPAAAASPPRAATTEPRLGPAPPKPSLARRPTPVHAPVLRRPAPVPAAKPRPRSEAPAIDFPAPGDPALSAQLASIAEPESAMVSRVAARLDDEHAARRASMPAVWIALTLMLGGALAYVVATRTDLFAGNVIENRNAEAQAEAEAEQAAAQAKIDATRVEYGTIEIDSEPKAARVFEVRQGPEARFEHLPIDHEYMVLVSAPGHIARTRVVKGSELAAPVIVDLDPIPEGATAPSLPDERPPKLAQAPSKTEATLTLRSNTPGAELGLLVGYTPGVKVIDVDVEQPHRYQVVLSGYQTADLVVKGRHFEESTAGLAYHETVKLVAASAVPVVEVDEDDLVVLDDAAAAPATAAKPKPAPTKKATKKRKKKKRRR